MEYVQTQTFLCLQELKGILQVEGYAAGFFFNMPGTRRINYICIALFKKFNPRTPSDALNNSLYTFRMV